MLRTGQFTPQLKLLYNLDRVNEWLEGNNIAPVLVEFDLSNACNQKCNFCTFQYIKDKSVLDYKTVIKTLDCLSKMGVRAINWTGGGEPLIHKDFTKIAQHAKTLGLKQGLFTNGSLLNKDSVYDILRTHQWVRISLDAGTRKTYSKIRRVDHFDKVLYNTRLLVEKRNNFCLDAKVGLGFVITPENSHEIPKFAEIVNETGVDYGQFKPCINDYTKDWQHEAVWWKNKILPILEQVSFDNPKIVVNAYKFQELLSKDKKRTYDTCYGHQFCPCIGATGDVWLCTHMRDIQGFSLGNLHNKSFNKIWNSKKRQKIIRNIDFKQCQFCCKNHEINKVLYALKNPDKQQDKYFL